MNLDIIVSNSYTNLEIASKKECLPTFDLKVMVIFI